MLKRATDTSIPSTYHGVPVSFFFSVSRMNLPKCEKKKRLSAGELSRARSSEVAKTKTPARTISPAGRPSPA